VNNVGNHNVGRSADKSHGISQCLESGAVTGSCAGCGLCCHRRCCMLKLPACDSSLQKSHTFDAGKSVLNVPNNYALLYKTVSGKI